jgi:phenol hydroxylase P2 protein
MSTVFIALQTNEDTRPIIEAIEIDNPTPSSIASRPWSRSTRRAAGHPSRNHRRATRPHFDLQELHINLITLSGNVDEDDDTLTLTWNN